MDRELNIALNKARGYLLSTQNPEGYWVSTSIDVKGPEYLKKPICITSQIIDALIYLELEDTSPITRAIFYCYKEKIEDTDVIDLLALKLKALSYSNAPFIQKQAKKLLNVVLKRQDKDGYWPGFPKTSNLTNYLVVDSITNYECSEALTNMKEWLLKHKAKDGLGWGLDENYKDSQVSFTANALITLLSCKEDAMSKNVQTAVKFLESKQLKDGGWPSSDLTYPVESTTYATSLVLLVLLRTTGNINSKTIESGIKFLINTQLEDGSWPLKGGDNRGEYFTTCCCVRTLKHYEYLKEKLKDKNVIELLSKSEKKQYEINYLLNLFESELIRNFIDSSYNNLLDKILATTSSAVKRRKTILNILENEGEKDTADIIEALKRLDGYKVLHKRSHLAQIKNDMDALVNLGFVEENKRKYYLVKTIGNF